MNKDTFDKAVLLNQDIHRLENELLGWEVNNLIRFSVLAQRSTSDPVGIEKIFEYPSKEIVKAYKLECLNALNQKLNELREEFNNL